MIELCSVRLNDGVSCHNAFTFYLDLTNSGISDTPQQSCNNCYVLANFSV